MIARARDALVVVLIVVSIVVLLGFISMALFVWSHSLGSDERHRADHGPVPAEGQILSHPHATGLPGITMFGFRPGAGLRELATKLGEPQRIRDSVTFPELSGLCYSFPSVGLKAQYFGGPDGGAIWSGPQIEQYGRVVARLGAKPAEIQALLGPRDPERGWSYRLALLSNDPTRIDSLTVKFDNSAGPTVRSFRIEWHLSVD